MPIWEDVYSVVEPQITADGLHVWPFATALPVDVRFFDFGDQQGKHHDLRMTRHDYCELLYVESGTGTYQIQEQFYAFKRGDLLVIGGMQFHRLREFRRAQMRAVALYFRPEAVASINTHGDPHGDEQAYLTPFLRQNKAFPHVIGAATGLPKEVFGLMKRIHQELPATDQRARLAAKTYLKMALMSLVNHYAAGQSTAAVFLQRQHSLDKLQPLFDHLERHYAESLTVEDAAALIGLSRSHFMRFYRQVTGQSFVAYLNHFRIAKAQLLLTTTEEPLAEISCAVGFCDQSYFGLTFRKLVGLTPLQYRQTHKPPL
ncbi:MAG: helix-turn-helix transcriptional regulator [Acidobacteria bacterium]|nr:helix-turn-helix transcriptional regulator [Acidobacteriota bacterium]